MSTELCQECYVRGHDNWPGKGGGKLCQECWEAECSREWWKVQIEWQKPMTKLGYLWYRITHPPTLPMGSRSLLYGSHQFLLHPLMVAIAWRKLYGFWPKGWRTWVAIFIHDWGYWRSRDMDGMMGKTHPGWAAVWCADVFGRNNPGRRFWFWFVGAHSRSFAKLMGQPPSPLMAPDKLATAMLPLPIYVALVWLSGEWVEYRDLWIATGKYPGRIDDGVWAWARHLQDDWARFHKHGAEIGEPNGGDTLATLLQPRDR